VAVFRGGVRFGDDGRCPRWRRRHRRIPRHRSRKSGEILVTGRGRSESLLKAPIADTAFSHQAIADANLKQTGDALSLVPNVSFTKSRQFGHGLHHHSRHFAGPQWQPRSRSSSTGCSR
jgi:hypothetical protein